MPNYLNKPISSNFEQTYVSQFVPLPLSQFARSQSRQQETQDNEVNTLSQTSDAAWKLSGIAKEDNDKIAEIRKSFDEVSSQLANRDLTQRENQEVARSLVKGVTRDKDLQTILSNKAKYDEYQKNKEEAIKNNTYQRFNDNGETTLNDYIRGGGYKSGKSIDPTIYKYEDTRPVRERLVDDMKANGQDIVAKFGDTFYKDGIEGVSKSQAYQTAKASLGEYLQTTAGAQDIREFQYMQRTNPKNKQLQNMDASDYVFSKILTAANERVYSKSSTGLAEAKNAEAKTKKEEQNVFDGILNTETPSTLANGRAIKFKEDGSIDGSGQGFVDAFKKHGFSLKTISSWWNDDSLNEDEAKDAKYITTGAKLNGVTPAQYAQIYNNTSHMKVEKPLIGKALRDNNQVLFNGGAGVWSQLNVMDTKTGERNMNFVSAIQKLADEKGLRFKIDGSDGEKLPDPNKNPGGFSDALKQMGVSITGIANPNEFSLKPVIFTVGNNSFAADMTFGGKQLPYKTAAENQKAQDIANFDRLEKGQQVVEKDSKGNDVIYFKDIKTGQIKHKLVKDLK